MIFGSLPVYRRVVTRLVDSGVLMDEGMVYFDAGWPGTIPPWRSGSPTSACGPRTPP